MYQIVIERPLNKTKTIRDWHGKTEMMITRQEYTFLRVRGSVHSHDLFLMGSNDYHESTVARAAKNSLHIRTGNDKRDIGPITTVCMCICSRPCCIA